MPEERHTQGPEGIATRSGRSDSLRSCRRDDARRLQDFAEAASDWFWEMGPDLRFTFLSDRIRDVTGVPADYFVGKRRDEIADLSSASGDFLQHLADLEDHRPFRDFVYRLTTPGGEPRYFKISGKPLFDDDGTFLGYRGTGTDITALKESSEKLDHTTSLLKTTLEHMDQGISVTDPDMNVVLWNDRFLELLEFPKDFPGEHGRPFADFIRYNAERGEYGPGDADEQVRVRVEMAKSFEPHSLERVRPDGTVIEIVGRPLPQGGFVTTYTDVTERKRKEELLQKQADEMNVLVEELKRSNAELEQFAYVASHDLQEPLRMVSSYCQLLERRYKDRLDEDAREFIAFAVDGANRMQQLINALLDYSRIGRSERPKERVYPRELLRAACRDLQEQIEECGARVEYGELPVVEGNEVELRQLFQNLISNAIKFRGEEPPRVRIDAVRGDGEWQFSVADNGIGIDPAYAERIFVIFQRLHNRDSYPGAGIGLSLCKKIVEHHGGRIWIDTQRKQGTAFHFTLPAMPEDQAL